MKSLIAVKAIIRKDDKILILKRASNDNFYPNYWETVGGGVKHKTSLEEELRREILEETGLEVKNIEPFRTFCFENENGEFKFGISFSCQYSSGKVILSEEHSEYKWIEPENISEYKTSAGVREEIKKFALKYPKKDLKHQKFFVSQKGILIRGDKCLIMRMSNHKSKWDLPGGRINVNENYSQALKREIKEELGFDNFENLGLIDYEAWLTQNGNWMCGIGIMIKNDNDSIKISSEHLEYRWVKESEIKKYDFFWECAPCMIDKAFKK